MNQTSPPQPLPLTLSPSGIERVVNGLPLEVRRALKKFPQLFVAGGFIRARLAGETPKDIDIFTTDLSIVDAAVDSYVELYHLYDTREVTQKKTPCTITVENGYHPPVQFVNNVAYKSPEECIHQFDFTVCQATIWCDADDNWQSLCTPEFIRDVAQKRLVYTAPNRVEAPGGSLWRAFKYAQRGYSITQQELARLIERLIEKTEEEEEDVVLYDDDDGDVRWRDPYVTYIPPPKKPKRHLSATTIARSFSMGGGYF